MIYNTYLFVVERFEEDPDHGVVFAESYENAVSKIIEYYGENGIINVKVELLNEGSIPILHTTETIEKALKTYYDEFM